MKLALLLLLVSSTAFAEGKGFQLDRYEPTPSGEWSFMVDRPWYSSTRWFSGGLTLDYAHDPLTYGTRPDANGHFTERGAIIAHQLVGHVDLAVSFLDRITLSATLPVVFLERGNAVDGVTPLGGGAVGDPRFGVMARLYGHMESTPLSVHLGVAVWAPIRWKRDQGDSGVRVMPKLVLGGSGSHVLWSFTGAFYYRPESYLGNGPASRGNSEGSEVQLGGAIGYADPRRGWTIGPEALLSTVVLGGDAFSKSYTGLELLLGTHVRVANRVDLGGAVSLGVLREPGTPDFRLLLRMAWAPVRAHRIQHTEVVVREPPPTPVLDVDTDHDGIVDMLDSCPRDAEDKDGFEDDDGCPDPDNDQDRTPDTSDRCPLQPGPVENAGCPDADRDGDTVVDRLDNCPDEPGDPANQGCKKRQLAQIRNGRIDILESVYFATDRDVILARSFDLLRNVADVMMSHPDLRVRVEGHTDSQGKALHNLDLSQRRAEAVRHFLVEFGVAKERLEAKGFGATQPIADNKTANGRSKNRRVVFAIIGDASGVVPDAP